MSFTEIFFFKSSTVKTTPLKSVRKRKSAKLVKMSTTESEAENLDGEQKSLLAENKWGKRSKKDIPNRLQLFAEYSFLITKSKIFDSLFFFLNQNSQILRVFTTH